MYVFDAWLDGGYGYDASGCDKSRDMWGFSCKRRDKNNSLGMRQRKMGEKKKEKEMKDKKDEKKSQMEPLNR